MQLYVNLGVIMLDGFFHAIYASNISTILIAIPIMILVWSVIGAAFYKYIRIIAAVMAVIAVTAILYITVLTRSESGAGADFFPFSSLERANICAGLTPSASTVKSRRRERENS